MERDRKMMANVKEMENEKKENVRSTLRKSHEYITQMLGVH